MYVRACVLTCVRAYVLACVRVCTQSLTLRNDWRTRSRGPRSGCGADVGSLCGGHRDGSGGVGFTRPGGRRTGGGSQTGRGGHEGSRRCREVGAGGRLAGVTGHDLAAVVRGVAGQPALRRHQGVRAAPVGKESTVCGHLSWCAVWCTQYMPTEKHSTCASVVVGCLVYTIHADRKNSTCASVVAGCLVYTIHADRKTARVHLLWRAV